MKNAFLAPVKFLVHLWRTFVAYVCRKKRYHVELTDINGDGEKDIIITSKPNEKED